MKVNTDNVSWTILAVIFGFAIGMILCSVRTGHAASECSCPPEDIQDVCVPVGKEWAARTIFMPLAPVVSPTGDPGIYAAGRNQGNEVVAVFRASDGEMVWLDDQPHNEDAPGFERGEGCTWREVNVKTNTKTEFVPGVIVKHGISL